MRRSNLRFADSTDEQIRDEIYARKSHMQSNNYIQITDHLYNYSDSYLSSEDLENLMGMARHEVQKMISQLRYIHGFVIENIAKKGYPAMYKLVGFGQPKGKGFTGKRVAKPRFTKPATFNPLIASVFS